MHYFFNERYLFKITKLLIIDLLVTEADYTNFFFVQKEVKTKESIYLGTCIKIYFYI